MSDNEKNYNDLAVLMHVTDFWVELSGDVLEGEITPEEAVKAFDSFMVAIAIKVIAATTVTAMLGEMSELDRALDKAKESIADGLERIEQQKAAYK